MTLDYVVIVLLHMQYNFSVLYEPLSGGGHEPRQRPINSPPTDISERSLSGYRRAACTNSFLAEEQEWTSPAGSQRLRALFRKE